MHIPNFEADDGALVPKRLHILFEGVEQQERILCDIVNNRHAKDAKKYKPAGSYTSRKSS
jgi:hypothetical protein